ncbi:hypothetical protein RND81_04G146700 [Saponaria officinalis]|uniref:Patatin n=1 Tax=Saponaria officinalis TaxID=3572 RepID=A0AAW1LPQ9_SAPOF
MELNNMTMEIFSKLEQQWLSTLTTTITTTADTKKNKILSIDGGGTSAFIAATFLVHLEQTLQTKTSDTTARIVDFFDIVAGTGVGAILAVLITAADSAGRPKFSAAEVEQFLINNRGKMFKPIKSGLLRGRSRRRCSAASLAKLLRETFGNKTLKDTCKPLLVPCYNTSISAPFVFSRAAANASGITTLDFELWKVCCAAIATPSIFEPFEIVSVEGKTSFTAVDGGIVMNNPAAVAVTHVLHNKVEFPEVNGVKDLMVLSLGNGTMKCRGSSERWSGKTMAENVVDAAVDGVSETVDQMLGNAFSGNRNDYVRIQANGLGGSGLMTKEEVLKERGIESTAFGAKRLLSETNADRIESFVQRLVNASPKSSLPPSPHKPLIPLLDGR